MSKILIAAVLVLSTGCATAFRQPYQSVYVSTYPEGADIKHNGNFLGRTPSNIPIPRSNSLYLEASRSGHEDTQGELKASFNGGWLAWDIISCVIPVALCIPLLTDAISGSWYDYPDSYSLMLRPTAPAHASQKPESAR